MTESTALTAAPQQTQAVAHADPRAATLHSIQLLLQPPGCRDLIPDGPLKGYSRAMVETVKATSAKGAPDAEVYRFLATCIRYNLDPGVCGQREAWCMNTAGKDQPAQWQVIPSRDGYIRAARRNPEVRDVKASIVRDGDAFTYDPDAGTFSHKPKVSKVKGATIGAYCQIVMVDGRRYVDFFYLADVRRTSKVWDQFESAMLIAAAQRTMLKRHVGLSDLYTEDRGLELIDSIESSALLVPPQLGNSIFDDMALMDGAGPARIAAPAPQIAAPTGPNRDNRNDGAKAFNARLAEIANSVDGVSGSDGIDARTAWLTHTGHPLLAKIEDAETVWGLVDMLDDQAAVDDFRGFLVEAREARWEREAKAREYADAGQTPPTAEAAQAQASFPLDQVEGDQGAGQVEEL